MSDNPFINEPYAPAPESTPVGIRDSYGHFIDNQFIDSEDGATRETINPSSGKVLSRIAEGSVADVDKAVRAARRAYDKTWSKLIPAERGKYLYRLARLIQEHSRELAVLESMDGGKPIRESRDIDIPLVAAYFFYYAGWADKLAYAFPNRRVSPHGVAGQIIPWNFPLLMAAWKIAPAVACGNTVVLKPAEYTPLTALKLAELVAEADFPPGVVNFVTGGSAAGKALVEHPDVDKVAFTGSTVVGKSIQSSLAGTGKPYTLELGGKAAHIVFEDAAIDQAVEGVVNGIFFNQGHVCCAGSRLLVQEGIAQDFYRKLEHRMKTLVLGDPLDKNTDIGAINNAPQLEKIGTYLDEAREEGLEVVDGGQSVPEQGYWCAPTFVKDAPQSSRIVREEVFGPVLTVQTFRTPDEAIEKANNTRYGLSGGVWTDKGSKIFSATSNIQAGVLWANTFNKFDPTAPFGGFKESGLGREGGMHGLDSYVKLS
ncbi:aldehyde dehydrogenase family protein [Puniceicoccales bacterium CK1056]|uniref:Aldehyde dehydrogenase family protein n=1 Tax=Oceanipulchritudo coccoides TaxID=2706888 RepID=A0A6B2M2V0_9BACT|nr:aldehyde dehydrogenase family protein [Oceanipulchritudo coccoides]NDV62726.1 aldehyde dehydrogenase family protein [Oceanipulchritudo coccoides]